VFLTDGMANQGILDNKTLKSLVHYGIKNHFVGIGKGHNAEMMLKLSDDTNAEYRFINSEEDTYSTYGDIALSVFYRGIVSVQLICKNCEIYDSDKNTWCDSLNIYALVSESKRKFPIKTRSVIESEIEVDVKGAVYTPDGDFVSRLLDTASALPSLDGDAPVTLIQEAFRHKTLELTYRAIHMKRRDENSDYDKLSGEFRTFFRTMIQYMKKRSLMQDLAMLNYCNDVKIAYKNLKQSLHQGSQAMMQTISRYTTQSRQCSANISALDEENEDDNEEPFGGHFQLPVMMQRPVGRGDYGRQSMMQRQIGGGALAHDYHDDETESGFLLPPVLTRFTNAIPGAEPITDLLGEFAPDEDIDRFTVVDVESQYACETSTQMIRGVTGQ
jgi:hypothetical protein